MSKTKKVSDDKLEIKIWRDRIDRGKKLRDKKMKEVKKMIRYYKNHQWSDISGYKEKPTVNVIFAHIKSQLPFLYFQNPKWFVKARAGQGQEFVVKAENAQALLNYYVNENLRILLKKQARLSILDAYFCYGVMKSGFISDVIDNKNYNKPIVLGEEDGKEVYDMDDKGNLKYDNREEIEVSQKFVARRISPSAMIFDTECINYFEDGRYIIEEISLPLADVRNDKKYKNTEKLKPSYSLKKSYILKDEKEEDDFGDELQRVTLYEIYDIEHEKIKVLADGDNDFFLRNEPTPIGIDGHPYSFLQFNDIPDEIYPLSDLRILKSSQDDINKSQSMINSHAKRFGRKFGYIEAMIEEDEMKKAESGDDGIFFKVKELPLNKVMEQLPTASLDDAVYSYQNTSKQNFDKLAATTEADRGVVERRKTATEANKIYQSSDLRKEDRRSLVEDFLTEVGTKILQSMQANLSVEEAMQISKRSDGTWIEITSKEDINGLFNVGVIVGSATPKLPEYERQDFTMFMQTLSTFPQDLIMKKVNFDAILTAASKMFPALEDIQLLNDETEQQAFDEQQKQKQVLETLLQMREKGGEQIPPSITSAGGAK